MKSQLRYLDDATLERLELMPPDQFKDALLLALGELVRKEISADQLLGRIVDAMADLLDADRGTLYLLDDAADELVSVAAHLPEMTELRVPLTQGVAGYVGRTGKVVNVPNSEDEERFWKKIDETTGYQTHSMLCGPIWSPERRLIGVIQLLNKRNGVFDKDDEARLEVLAAQAAALLEQTTLRPRHALVRQASERLFTRPATTPTQPLMLGERYNGIIGEGKAMTELLRNLRRVAQTEATVLLRGESGTGKSLVARALHHNSTRADKPFVHVDCTTLPVGLMENELFGHERGAFTGASERTVGKVAAAEGGTLFLDEVGELELSLQTKLLTLLQERTFTPVGGTARKHADVRFVTATNRDLEQAVRDGAFREDLYYRLRVVELRVPTLRERGRGDLTHLIEHFVERAARRHGRAITHVAPDALERLLAHPWPGNVRELENCLESAVIFADEVITADVLPLQPGLQKTASSASGFDGEPSLAELEARYIAHLLELHDGNRSECARILGIGRNTPLRKIRDYALD